ncbi:hypothetical protein [Flavobacterium sp.]|jgi:hypothetical protein|uniref:hypothetical protein n=1 Tax=Flavobacterium sp. TaxID=239 RepID=UPI0037BE6A59
MPAEWLPSWALHGIETAGRPSHFCVEEEETLSLSGIEHVNVSSAYIVEYPDEEDPIEPLSHDMALVPYSRSSENGENILNRTFDVAPDTPETTAEVLNRTFVLGRGEGTMCTRAEDEKGELQELCSLPTLPEDGPIIFANYGSYLDIAPDSGIFDAVMQRKVPRSKVWQDTRPASKKTRNSLHPRAPKTGISDALTKKEAPPRIKGRPATRPAFKMTRTSLMRGEIGRSVRLGDSIKVRLEDIFDDL